MGLVPEGQPKYNDLIDIVIQSAKKNIDVMQPDGTIIKDSVIDEEIIWWKTGSVNSHTLPRFTYEVKEWERQAEEAKYHMTAGRAAIFARQVLGLGQSLRRSIDSASSSSLRDKVNSQATLLDKINRNKIERVHTIKGEMKRSFSDALMGREGTREAQEED